MASGDFDMALGHLPQSRKTVMLVVGAVATVMALIASGYSRLPAFSETWIRQTADGLGVFGPIAMIGLMVLAIVVSPIPSGPIAVAAGALYGAAGGAIVSIIGAEVGALVAFGLSRYFGFDAVRRSQNPIMTFIATPRSQHRLMWIVFASRLIPFVSFDAISYATGLTNLSFSRFAIATGLGIVPICWTLAAMGAGMVTGGIDWGLVVIVGGGITLVPAVVTLLRTWRRH
jgi:uncharacterized membrane protein YdjX (TVP38/TMEM64 family)